jgi:hypothetical protein
LAGDNAVVKQNFRMLKLGSREGERRKSVESDDCRCHPNIIEQRGAIQKASTIFHYEELLLQRAPSIIRVS